MSKGSSPRPFGVNRAQFESNWDKIFKQEKRKEAEKWEHNCKHNGTTWLSKNEECNWCGAKEND
jgi:hypothetical protein